LLFLVLIAPYAVQGYQYNEENYIASEIRSAEIQDFAMKVGSLAPYIGGENPWCNTMLYGKVDLTYHLLGLPAGQGLQLFWYFPGDNYYKYIAREPSEPLRSGYVLLPGSQEQYPGLFANSRLTELAVLPQGTLYRNESSPCFCK